MGGGENGSGSGPWYVPHAPNPYFTGRAKILNEVRAALLEHGLAFLSHARSLPVHGGVGKTQAALAYVMRGRKEYQAVFWIRAASPLGLSLECLEIGRAMGLVAPRDRESARAELALRQWLNDHRDWLVVFEDVRHPAFLESWLPPEMKGQVVIVAASANVQEPERAARIEVPVMPAEEAAHFLFKRTGRVARDRSERDAAAGIALALLYFPLALELAAAYIVAKTLSFTEYRKRLQEKREAERTLSSGQDAITTALLPAWAISFDEIEQESTAAVELLKSCAYLDGSGIPIALVEPTGFPEGAPPGVAAAVPAETESAVEVLARYGVVRRGLDGHTLVVPRLFQALLTQDVSEAGRRSLAWQTIQSVHRFVEAQAATPLSIAPTKHVERAAVLIRDHRFEDLKAGQVLRWLGLAQAQGGDFRGADQSLRRALELYEKLGESHEAELAAALHEVGLVALARSEYDEAKRHLDRAVIVASQVLPRHHPDVATYLHSLGRLHAMRREEAEAERCYLQALSIRERALSAEDPDVAVVANSLAVLFHDQRRYAEAESLITRVVYIVKRSLPSDHPDIATCVHNLAVVLHSRRRYADAEPYYKDALGRKERTLPPSSPGLLATLESYALVLRKLHRSGEAALLEARARTLRRTALPLEEQPLLARPA